MDRDDKFRKTEERPKLSRANRIIWPGTIEGRLQKTIAECATALAGLHPSHPAFEDLTREEWRAVNALAEHYRTREAPLRPLSLGGL